MRLRTKKHELIVTPGPSQVGRWRNGQTWSTDIVHSQIHTTFWSAWQFLSLT